MNVGFELHRSSQQTGFRGLKACGKMVCVFGSLIDDGGIVMRWVAWFAENDETCRLSRGSGLLLTPGPGRMLMFTRAEGFSVVFWCFVPLWDFSNM